MLTFSVLPWNVENLFQVQDEDGPDTVEQYQQKIDNLATVIQQLNSNIIALQEVGNPDTLQDLTDHYPHSHSLPTPIAVVSTLATSPN